MQKLKMHSLDLTHDNVSCIKELFPNCVTEALDDRGQVTLKVDFDLLRQELSAVLVEGPQERYRLDWPGKQKAMLTANAPINKSLRPCREESMNFDTTENLYIEGDNLEVLKLLQESYLGKVRMIYIDPPYNTGNDFIYKDKYAEDARFFLRQDGQYDDEGKRMVPNLESNGRFHSGWLSMMYSRLRVARNLLADHGIIFISIDDGELENLKKICNEIFGAQNFLGCAGRITKKSNNKGDYWAPNFDYLLTYSKNIYATDEFSGGANIKAYNMTEEEGLRKGEKYQLVRLYMSTIRNRNPEQRFWIECPDGSKVIPPGTTLPPERPNLGDGIWRWTKTKFDAEREKIVIKEVRSSNLINEHGNQAKWNVYTKTYLNDVLDNASAKPNSFIEEHINQIASHELNALNIPFDYAKPTTLIKYLMDIARIGSDSFVLDFFSGSATTAHAVMQLNAEDGGKRKFIMVQWPETCPSDSAAFKAGFKNICEIGKERIRRAGKKIREEKPAATRDLDTGFRVLKVKPSCMADVYYTPDETKQQTLSVFDNINPDVAPEDLLFQVLTDWGVELHLHIAPKAIQGKNVYFVDENRLAACFDSGITEDFIKELAAHKPVRVVFRDAGFASDAARINAEQIFKQLSPDTEVRVL